MGFRILCQSDAAGRSGKVSKRSRLKILFTASECVPFCKTGGLADVVGSLPKALRQQRHDVRIILPKYKSIRTHEFNLRDTGEKVHVPVGSGWQDAKIFEVRIDPKLTVYLLENDRYFGRPGLYRSAEGDYADNAERFIFLSRASLEACKALEFRPDVIHCHDWQTGLVPAYLKTVYRRDAFFQHTASIFTIHNIAYQGQFPKDTLALAGLPWEEYHLHGLEFYGHMNFMKAGLIYSDLLTTVSPSYAREIQSSSMYGFALEGVLRHRSKDLFGILNGLDMEEWNPSSDPFLAKPFDAAHLQDRRESKTHLQQIAQLTPNPKAPLLGIVARLDVQKGLDLVANIVPDLMRHGVQLVVLGQGDPQLQRQYEQMAKRYPGQFYYCSEFNEPLAHYIYAGSDIFLMPSRFEPCGLSQMIAMRYGAIPVVTATGGLLDTVLPFGPGDTGTGFLFYDPTPSALMKEITRALTVFHDEPIWTRLQLRAMAADFSWTLSAQKYVDAYRLALGRRSPSRVKSRRTPKNAR